MRDVLSQREIDMLMSSLARGELQVEEDQDSSAGYQKYDFRRQTKFSKEQIRTLQIIHENYSRIMGNFLSAYFRVPVKMSLVSVSQVTYEEFLLSLPIPTLMTIYKMAPDMGPAMFETSPYLALVLIDLIFGGEGEVPKKSRELTEIELTVMREVNTRFLENLRYVWKGVAPLEPSIESLDTNPQFNQVISSSETVALVTLSATIGDTEGLINLCYPYLSLEKAIPNLTAQFWFNNAMQTVEQKSILDLSLHNVEVELSVRLGSTTLSLEELLQFQVGGLLILERREKEELDIFVEDQLLFKGQPGKEGTRLAALLKGLIDEEKGEGENE
ncbi:MAG: flagellar motor switch protein FliM [Dethiobacteria bacterium]|jgi:flagellar motor switch protein FliM